MRSITNIFEKVTNAILCTVEGWIGSIFSRHIAFIQYIIFIYFIILKGLKQGRSGFVV